MLVRAIGSISTSCWAVIEDARLLRLGFQFCWFEVLYQFHALKVIFMVSILWDDLILSSMLFSSVLLNEALIVVDVLHMRFYSFERGCWQDVW